ncbi:hypothetical protein C6P77_22950 [Burkholderia ambifaria]|nr:hypothetical protein C6P77_22950 [Burkholderia ambifaria]
MTERSLPFRCPEDEVIFFTERTLRAAVPTLPEWPGLTGVPPRVPRFPMPMIGFGDAQAAHAAAGAPAPACLNTATTAWRTVSEYSCYG